MDAIAVTCGPGLAGALLVGVSAAKAYAAALNVPLYGVNHLPGHVAADTLQHGLLPSPCLALLVSGGHTQLLQVDELAGKITEIGSTIDDAAGEAYDKVARIIGLPYPGGPPIDKAARRGNPDAIRFPRGLTGPRDAKFDFSFSGLKTAVARWVENREKDGRAVPVDDVAASFQEAVADVLTDEGRPRREGAGHRHHGDLRRGRRQLPAVEPRRAALRGGRHRAARAAAPAVHGQRRHDRRARCPPRRGRCSSVLFGFVGRSGAAGGHRVGLR